MFASIFFCYFLISLRVFSRCIECFRYTAYCLVYNFLLTLIHISMLFPCLPSHSWFDSILLNFLRFFLFATIFRCCLACLFSCYWLCSFCGKQWVKAHSILYFHFIFQLVGMCFCNASFFLPLNNISFVCTILDELWSCNICQFIKLHFCYILLIFHLQDDIFCFLYLLSVVRSWFQTIPNLTLARVWQNSSVKSSLNVVFFSFSVCNVVLFYVCFWLPKARKLTCRKKREWKT